MPSATRTRTRQAMSDASSEIHSDSVHPVQRPLMEIDPAQDGLDEGEEAEDDEEEGVPGNHTPTKSRNTY